MKSADATLKRIARLVDSLEEVLDVLESAHQLQFESIASLKDKLLAVRRARSALTKARRLRDLIAQTLVDTRD